MDEEDKKVMGFLEEQGAISWEGIDENGEALFKFNLPILKEVHPKLYNAVMEDLDKDLMELYKNGLIEIEYDENLEAKFKLSEEAQRILESGQFPFSN